MLILIWQTATFLARLFSKKTSRYCHSPASSAAASSAVATSSASCENFDIF